MQQFGKIKCASFNYYRKARPFAGRFQRPGLVVWAEARRIPLPLAYIEDGKCRLVSRHRNTYKSFETLAHDLSRLPVNDAILDGKIICLDSEGRSQFKELSLSERSSDIPCIRFVVDTDLRKTPLIERKKTLQRQRLIHRRDCSEIIYAQHVEGQGKLMFEEVCERNLEGIVCKRKRSIYAEHGWIKIKNAQYTHAEGRHEMFTAFREPRRNRAKKSWESLTSVQSSEPSERTLVYLWQLDYIAALLETDDSMLPRRLYAAIAAIEQRLLSPVEPGSVEDHAIKQAQKVIAVIRADQLDLKQNPSTSLEK
jgi:ATP dependent DNA ligase domain